MTDDTRSQSDHTVEHATCLGCGCSCDDITVVVRGDRIRETPYTCALGERWFGDGDLPARISAPGTGGAPDSDIQAALEHIAKLLTQSTRTLVYLSTDIPCESQRVAIGIADVLGATVDSVTSATARESVLSGQRHGCVTATLGEIKNRADAVVFWGVDPAVGYPRFASRYAPDPVGLYVAGGRGGRTVIAVDIGANRGPADADARTAFAPEEEVAALSLMRMFLLGRGDLAAAPTSLAGRAGALARQLTQARYIAVVADGEASTGLDVWRSEALSRLVEGLNRSARAALITLRAGGNRSAADAALTSQTGYPMAVDFSSGAPTYCPDDDASSLLATGGIDTALIVGSPHGVPDRLVTGLAKVTCIALGPRASESPFPTACAIDTGVAGIHERGTAIRMDGIFLPLRPALEAPVVGNYHTAGDHDRPGSQLAVARALAVAGLPQDSYLLLGALTRMLPRQ